jgi:hypothetical protein
MHPDFSASVVLVLPQPDNLVHAQTQRTKLQRTARRDRDGGASVVGVVARRSALGLLCARLEDGEIACDEFVGKCDRLRLCDSSGVGLSCWCWRCESESREEKG